MMGAARTLGFAIALVGAVLVGAGHMLPLRVSTAVGLRFMGSALVVTGVLVGAK